MKEKLNYSLHFFQQICSKKKKNQKFTPPSFCHKLYLDRSRRELHAHTEDKDKTKKQEAKSDVEDITRFSNGIIKSDFID